MSYTPKHAAPRRNLRRALGVGVVSVATATAGVAMSSAPAHAAGDVWDRLAQCEAGGNWNINSGNGFYGGLQFTLQSWRGVGGTAYAPRPDLASREQQIAAGQRLLAMQGPGAWPVCSVRAGLTRSNGGTSAPAPTVRRTAPQAVARKAPQAVRVAPKVVKPAAGRLSTADTRAVQLWASGRTSNGWTVQAIERLQQKLRVTSTGRTDARTIKAAERLVGLKQTGLNYFTQPALNKLAAKAKADLKVADARAKANAKANSMRMLVTAVEGGTVSPTTVALAARPASYR